MAKSHDILKLKCGQMALGMLEVKKKAAELSQRGKKKLRHTLKKNPVQVIRAPDRSLYIVDGHHHAAAVWLAGGKKIYIEVVEDFSKGSLGYKDFWKKMRQRNCVHLFDQFGHGPHDPLYLPQDVRGLGDDPYRSLAWLVREEGAVEKSDQRFADFAWANFFRRHRLLHGRFGHDFKSAKKKAIRLARSGKARALPGYITKKKRQS